MRAAAKNHSRVTILCDPSDFEKVVQEMEASPKKDTQESTRSDFRLQGSWLLHILLNKERLVFTTTRLSSPDFVMINDKIV